MNFNLKHLQKAQVDECDLKLADLDDEYQQYKNTVEEQANEEKRSQFK